MSQKNGAHERKHEYKKNDWILPWKKMALLKVDEFNDNALSNAVP